MGPCLSGVPQGTVLGPLLFSLYINDITEDIDSDLRLFADDCVCYREIKDTEDTVKLQEDIDHLGCWARSWGKRFQPAKCNIMQITRKRIKRMNASYSLEARLAGKYRWWEFPAVITGNYRPGKYSKFCQSGKYWEI